MKQFFFVMLLANAAVVFDAFMSSNPTLSPIMGQWVIGGTASCVICLFFLLSKKEKETSNIFGSPVVYRSYLKNWRNEPLQNLKQ